MSVTKPLSPDDVNAILGLPFDFESWLEAWVNARLTAAIQREIDRMTSGNGVPSDERWD